MKRIYSSIDYKCEGWDNFFTTKGMNWRDKDYRLIKSMFKIEDFCGSLLDVGCGLGDGLRLLINTMTKIQNFAGCDFSQGAIKKNQSNSLMNNIFFFVHDISKSLPDKYDNVICLQTLEHLQDPAKAMKNLTDATKAVLVAASPYKNRRPDENHLWEFDEFSFQGEFQIYLDRKEKNIFWILDKRETKTSLRKTQLPRFLEKLLYKI